MTCVTIAVPGSASSSRQVMPTRIGSPLGVTLINRTTRELSLTEAGAVYLEGCRETLARLRQAESAVHELGGQARGSLRIACPIIRVEQIVGPLLTAAIGGQLLAAIILDHYGMLGLARQPVSVEKIAGVLLVLLGAWLVRRG